MISANAAGSGPRIDISVDCSCKAVCRDDGPTTWGSQISGAAQSQAASPRGSSVELLAGSPRITLLRSRS